MSSRRSFSALPLVAGTSLACIVAACSGDDTKKSKAPPGDTTEPLVCEPVEPGAAPARLLTRIQYNNTIRDLFGDDSNPADAFPPENEVLGFETNAELHQANPLLVNDYLGAAETIATTAMSSAIARYLPCAATGRESEGCVDQFIDNFGEKAFRRPLEPEERAAFLQLQQTAKAKYGFPTSIQLVVEAALQSPQFLYRIDSYSAPTEETGAVAIVGYEMASRLSYFLWNSMPDQELFDAASAGELRTAAQVEAQARRLLTNPRARGVVQDFHRQWLLLDRFGGLEREATQFPTYEDQLPFDLRASLEAYIDHVYWSADAKLDTLFGSPRVFINDQLAKVFGVEGVTSSEFQGVDLDSSERVGLLTQPGLLALHAHPDQSSPIKRGIFVRERILCDELPPPPPSVDPTPPDPDPNLTTRERFKEHTEAPTCAQCHDKIDGLGFGLENYDQLGRYRADEHGLPVDASGTIVDPDDAAIEGPYDGPVELATKLGQSPQVRHCVAIMWYRYAMGRIETADDACSLRQVTDTLDQSDGDLHELLVSLTLSDAFRFRPPGEQDY